MKFAFIGAGKMASALMAGMLAKPVCAAKDVIISSKGKERLQKLIASNGATMASSNLEAVTEADVVLLCVKPKDAVEVLTELNGTLKGKLLISIVTGLTLSKMEELAGSNCRCIRVMPNTPVMVGAGASAYSAAANALVNDIDTVKTIFGSLGIIVEVREEQMDAVTAVSGSGPAYVYLMIEALSDAGVSAGLSPDMAQQLAVQTVAGAAEMVLKTGQHPGPLREMVTSPGGTTAEALRVMESRDFRGLITEAVEAAARKAKELSKG
ncbi:MAG: pyrroline-5-carboxylate reductase [Chthoniobacterales bacterium]